MVTAQEAHSCDQLGEDEDGNENEERCHGRNYALEDFLPPVAGLTTAVKFLPY